VVARHPAFALAISIAACGDANDLPAPVKEPEPPPIVSVPPHDPPARFPWAVFPKQRLYTTHYRGASTMSIPTVETFERREIDGGELITVSFEQPNMNGEGTIRSVTTLVLNDAGLNTASEVETLPGRDPTERRYDPARLEVPANVIPGTKWTTTRAGTNMDMSTLPSSLFCEDGFRVVIRAPTTVGPAGRLTHHWCPGTGWRGQDSITRLEDGSHIWMWTAGLIADGQPLPDPPDADRFPEFRLPE
jgi:hypothetical protein